MYSQRFCGVLVFLVRSMIELNEKTGQVRNRSPSIGG